MTGGRPFLPILGMAVLAALLLALPERTVATRSLQDLFYILDGVNRVLWGQVPGRDFVTSLGPLVHYLPALGQRIGGWGAALPVAMATTILLLSPAMAHVLTSRLHPVLAWLMGGFLILVLAAPMNLGEAMTALSFGQFHNRIGWVALALLLVMILPPHRPVPVARDAVAAALLAFVLVYVRLTYGLVAVGFLLFMLTEARQRGWASLALAGLAVAALVMELLWGGSAGYVRATRMAFGAGGVLRGSWGDIADHVLVNFTDYVLLGLIAGLSRWRGPSLRYALFFAFCAVGGFWLINQNDQRWGILALHAAAVVAAERILREDEPPAPAVWATASGVRLFVLALVLPTLLHNTVALGLHVSAAVAGTGRPMPISGMEGVRLADLWTGGDFAGDTAYLATVTEGIDILRGLDPAPRTLAVLDAPDPFTLALGLPPGAGMMPVMLWQNTVGPAAHPPAEQILSGADTVILRRIAGGTGPVAKLYLPFLRAHFRPVSDTEHWRIYRRVTP